MVRARDWARFQLAMELYSVDVYCSLYWLIVGLFAFFSSDGWRSATFDDICDFPLAIRRALIAAPTILVRHASHDNLPQLCALASPTAAPELRSSIVYLQRLWKLESPSVSSILRLLRAIDLAHDGGAFFDVARVAGSCGSQVSQVCPRLV